MAGFNTGLKCLKFYENWYVMAESRDTDEKRLAFYDAIMRYAFSGIIPKAPEKGVSKGVEWAAWDGFNATRPVIDGVIEREVKSFAGRIGGMAVRGEEKSNAHESVPSRFEEQAPLQARPQAQLQADLQAQLQAPSQAEPQSLNKEKEKENEKEKDNENMNGSLTDDDVVSMFESFWKSYPGPRKQDKKKCREKFARLMRKSKDPVSLFNAMMNSLENVWKRCDIWTRDGGQYIKGPLVWLNNENWNDTPGRTVSSASVPNVHHSATAEVKDVF